MQNRKLRYALFYKRGSSIKGEVKDIFLPRLERRIESAISSPIADKSLLGEFPSRGFTFVGSDCVERF